jgi:pimeloyl-ACP methyl ester carboxylesterase
LDVLIHVRGVVLGVETFGDPADPTILLVAGRGGSRTEWPTELCDRLVAGGRHVVRYDHRDTGRSTTCPPGEPDYTFADLVADALGILDGLGVARAHVVGISMGGALAQHLAVRHPIRVASLTLLSTTSGLDWPDDLPEIGDLPADVPDDHNHGRIESGPAPTATLADIAQPTLVVHGSADPLFPPGHGEVLARRIPVATFLLLDGVAHEVPPPRTWDVVVPALLHISD